MPELYLDLRNDAALAILAEKGAVLYSRAFTQKVSEGEALKQLVTAVRSDSGLAFKAAHLLVPGSEVTLRLHRTQATAMEDARLIIGRAVAMETGEAAPLFLLTRMAMEHGQQVYLAESLPRLTLERYLQMFREARLRLLTVSTAFQARQAFLAELPGDMHQIQALFDLDSDGGIEATFFSNTEILQHEVLAGGGGAATPASANEDDAERSGRRKLYETMNNLHIVYSRFMNQHPQAVMGKIWLGGPGAAVSGVAVGLAEAMESEVGLLVPDEVKDVFVAQAYVAAVGCIRQLQKQQPVNFLPSELRKRFQINPRVAAMAAGGLFVLLLLATLGVTEKRYAAAKRELADEQIALQALQASSGRAQEQLRDLRKLDEAAGKQLPIYDIFRELTVLLPLGVYLENMECVVPAGKDGGDVKLTTVMVYDTEFGSRMLLSQYISALKASKVLSQPEEPVITYRTLGERKLLVAAVTCKVAQRKIGAIR
ncbi:MAG: hypothetical protein HGA96_02155 [Desulfobulbaceae bacterium]|nr:hypothetical protein [Desulfobulbaceae bacterium]